MLVFIDDSGDPGFKTHKGSTPVFVIALIIFDDELEAEKTSLSIKVLRRKLKVSDMYEFKFNKTNDKFRNTFLENIKNFKFRVRAVVVDKETIYSPHLKLHIENFYNYIIMQVLKHNDGTIKKAKLKFDRRGERVLRDQLRVYLSNQLDNKHTRVFNDLKFVDSKQNILIQLADMVAGSIFSAYSGKNNNYLGLLKETKRIEDIWLFK